MTMVTTMTIVDNGNNEDIAITTMTMKILQWLIMVTTMTIKILQWLIMVTTITMIITNGHNNNGEKMITITMVTSMTMVTTITMIITKSVTIKTTAKTIQQRTQTK